jgi:hypothetical protein
MNVRRAIMRASVSDENRPAIAPYAREELLACVIARLIAQLGNEARHVAVGAASPIPAAGALLLKQKRPELRLSFLHKRRGNPFTEGSRELFDLAGRGASTSSSSAGRRSTARPTSTWCGRRGAAFPARSARPSCIPW